LNGNAAGTILERFKRLFPDDEFPTSGQVAKTSVDRLRTAGLSRPKAAYIIDLAKRCNAGWPTAQRTAPVRRRTLLFAGEQLFDEVPCGVPKHADTKHAKDIVFHSKKLAESPRLPNRDHPRSAPRKNSSLWSTVATQYFASNGDSKCGALFS
jgi:hypothetical protein